MNISREEKKAEAIARMKAWGIFNQIISQFENENLISESAPPFGACYNLNEEQLARIRDFETKYDALVYHVIHSYTNIGEMESYLYVGDNREEWALDREDIEYGQQLVYVYNKDAIDCSEFGSIGIKLSSAAGLQRIW